MGKNKRSFQNPVKEKSLNLNSHSFSFLSYFPLYVLSSTLFLTPLFPDEKLNRLKLIVFGTGLILALFLWATEKFFEEKWIFYKTKSDPYLLFYFISAVLYYKSSANPSVALSEFQRMFFSVGCYFIAAQICSGTESLRRVKIVLNGWICGLALIAFYGILQKSGGIGRIMVPQMDRVFGTFGNPIFFAAFLIISIPVTLAVLIQSKNNWSRLLLTGTLVLSGLALFYTKTRAAFFSLPISLMLFYFLSEYGQNWKRTKKIWELKRKFFFFFCFFIAAHLVFLHFSEYYLKCVKNIESAIHDSRVTATQQTHTLIWKDVIRMWRSHPWFGTGYGTFHIEFPQYASQELLKVFPQNERIVNDAHNEYLQILAETGTVGFLIFMSFIVIFYLNALKTVYQIKKNLVPAENNSEILHEKMVIFYGFFSGISALLLENFFSVDMRFIISSAYLFLTMGLVSSLFSKPVEMQWGSKPQAHYLKSVWMIFFLFLSGIVGISIDRQSFYVVGIYEYGKENSGIWSWKKTPAMGPGLFPALIRPYMAQKVVSRTADFFDEKLLNAAQTINDFEKLVLQYPQQWKYWERLGYALAKEIQKTDSSGKKVIDAVMTERAIAAYKEAHKLNPQAEGPSNNLGNIYYTVNNRLEAIEWWKKTIENNPDKVDARINLGLAYYYQGKIKEAAQQFEEVLKRDPRNEKAIVMLKRMVE